MESHRTRIARPLLTIALFTGLLGDLLLRSVPWGVNFSLWGITLLAAVVLASRYAGDPLPREAWLLALSGALCAAFLALRDSPALAVWNVAALLCAAALLAVRIPSLSRLTSIGLVWNLMLHAGYAIAGMAMLLGGTTSREGPADPARRSVPWVALVRGILLALPPLLIFSAMLSSADARFEYVIKEVLRIDAWTVVSHLLLTAFLAWVAGGVLWGRFAGGEIALPRGVRPGASTIGMLETAILLGSLDLLFLGFVAVQFSYFFGGDAIVQTTTGLTYADYARRGFFELVGVLCLALPLLLTADWIVRKDRIPAAMLFRVLAGVMVVLLLAILGSAVQRLWLYAAAYGLTESRVHAGAVLLWIALMLVWFVLSVLRGRRERFLSGAIFGGYAVLILLNTLNPDALVARVNLDRVSEGIEIDPRHTASLSADAVPEILERLQELEPAGAALLARTYLARYPDAARGDWRSWNTSRARAATMVRDRVPVLLRAGQTY